MDGEVEKVTDLGTLNDLPKDFESGFSLDVDFVNSYLAFVPVF